MEPRTTSRLQRKEAAFEVKAEGNERFRNGRLRSALECYEEASECPGMGLGVWLGCVRTRAWVCVGHGGGCRGGPTGRSVWPILSVHQ